MRVLVLSDSHGRNENVKKVIEQAGECDMMIHLGDVQSGVYDIYDWAKCPQENVYIVSGNNDYGLDLPLQLEVQIGRYRAFLTHGHRFYIHGGTDHLEKYARENGYDIVMFGHTHVPLIQHSNGVTLINPGSVAYPRQDGREKTFLIMDIDRKGEAHYSHGTLKEAKPSSSDYWFLW